MAYMRSATHFDEDGPTALAWRMTEYQRDVSYIRAMVEREYGKSPSCDSITQMLETRKIRKERAARGLYVESYNEAHDDGAPWSPALISNISLEAAINVSLGDIWDCEHKRTPATTHRIGERVMCRVCRRRKIQRAIHRVAHRKSAREAALMARLAAKESAERKAREAQSKVVLSDAEAAVNTRGRLPLDELKRAVAAKFGIRAAEIDGPNRSRKFVHPRAVVAQILLERGCSYPVIGRCLGGRDHSTAIHMIRNFAMYSEMNPLVPEAYQALRDRKAAA